MNVNIKHLALGISVAVVLLCVFAGASGISSVKTIPVPNDYDYSTGHQMIGNATSEFGDTCFGYGGVYPHDKLSPSCYKIANAPIYNDFYGDVLSNIAIVHDTSPAHLTKTASRYYKPTDTEHLYGRDVNLFKVEDDGIYALDVVPHAQFSLDKNFEVWAEDDAIMSGMYEFETWYGLGIYNYDDASDTVFGDLRFSAQADNINRCS